MYTKTLFLLATISICFNAKIFSQAPEIEWQNTISGDKDDFLKSLQPTSDGGYIVGGYSYSGISGDKTEAKLSVGNSPDYWVLKLNSAGGIVWQNTIGAEESESLGSLDQTSDGGYILGGYSKSGISGDKSEINRGAGGDYWVVKLNGDGIIEWDKTIGGSDHEELNSIQQTSDGGYILGGNSMSGISGEKSEDVIGDYDYWVVKLNNTGAIEWENTIGGNNDDVLNAIQQTSDGGYIIGGSSRSDLSGDKTEANLGYLDYWVVKLNSTGAIEWQNTIGGSHYDELYSIQQTADGGYILSGNSQSNISLEKSEDNIGPSGNEDYWVVKLNSTGAIEWENTIGGSELDEAYPIQQTPDGGYIIGGWSESGISYDKTEASLGDEDLWVLKLNSSGGIEWQNTIGGAGVDGMRALQQTSDGGYIIGAYGYSGISGDKTENSLAWDYWVVKLYPEDCNGITVYADGDSDGYGDAANSIFAADCIIPDGYINNDIDCNDNNATANPLGTEVCNNLVDEDCNGIMDDCVCSDPTSLDEAGITATTAILHWDAVTGAEGNRFRYKGQTVPGWTIASTSNNFKKITGLSPGTHYVWQVKTICSVASGNTSDWSLTQLFSTDNLRLEGEMTTETLEAYPNPFTSSTTIRFSMEESSNITIELFDMTGRKLETLLHEYLEAGSHEVNLDRRQLPAGMYVVKMKTSSSVATQSIIIQ